MAARKHKGTVPEWQGTLGSLGDRQSIPAFSTGIGTSADTPEMFWSILCLPVSAHQGFEQMAAASLPSASLTL